MQQPRTGDEGSHPPSQRGGSGGGGGAGRQARGTAVVALEHGRALDHEPFQEDPRTFTRNSRARRTDDLEGGM